MSAEGEVNVSRETIEMLEQYCDLVRKWNPKINLISKSSLPHLWERHIKDSAQIYTLAESNGNWVDLGSGGGFPGIVIAILRKSLPRPASVTLVESDQRKATFLRTVSRELDLNLTVITARIEEVPPLNADILSARALANLSALLEFAERHLNPKGTALFPKGETWQDEVDQAKNRWSYEVEAIKSETHPDAAILKIKDIKRV